MFDLDLQQSANRTLLYLTEQHADHPTVGDDQHTLSCVSMDDAVPCGEHTRLKLRQRLAIGRCVLLRIGPEAYQRIRLFLHQFGRTAAFPGAEVNLAQALLDGERQRMLLCKLSGETGAAFER